MARNPVGASLTGVLLLAAGFGAAPPAAAAGHSATHGITLHLSPDSGPPGTKVTLSGVEPAAAANPQQFGNIDFGGFPNGLSISASSITWSKSHPGAFVTHFTVPEVPWLSPHGEATLKAGPYTVGIQCFGVVEEGCGLRPDAASTTFHLTGPIPVSYRTPTLSLSPAAARPGETVSVHGWAPLTNIIGIPFGYSLVFAANGQTSDYGSFGSVQQAANGDLSGTIRIPAIAPPLGTVGPTAGHMELQYVFTDLVTPNKKGAGFVTLDPAPFKIAAPLTWDAVKHQKRVIDLTSNQNMGVVQGAAVAGGHPVVAQGGDLWRRVGSRWQTVPTAGVRPVIKRVGLAVYGEGNGVSAVVASPGHPADLFISLWAGKAKEGIPPALNTGLYTEDGGGVWHLAPPPHGMTVHDFGGFSVVGRAVWAWWQNGSSIRTTETLNGGATWQTMPARCPGVGTCVMLGPVPPVGYGQMVTQTEALVTARGGRWVSVGATISNINVMSQVAQLGPRAVLWIGDPGYPVQISYNDGTTWRYVALPNLPGESSQSELTVPHLLPNGVMLAADPVSGRYYELKPGQANWREVPLSLAPMGAALTVVGQMVDWVGMPTGSGSTAEPPPTFLEVPVARY